MNSPRFEQPHSEDLRFVCQADEHDIWISKDGVLIARYGNSSWDYESIHSGLFKMRIDSKNISTEDIDSIPYLIVWKILLDNPEWHGILEV